METITRLEDLAPELQKELLTLAIDAHYDTPYESWDILYEKGLVDSFTSINDDNDHLTERGAALVADFKRRHESTETTEPTNNGAASAKPQSMTDTEFFSNLCKAMDINQRDNDEHDVVRLVGASQSALNLYRKEYDVYKSASKLKESRIEELGAEVKRLQEALNEAYWNCPDEKPEVLSFNQTGTDEWQNGYQVGAWEIGRKLKPFISNK